jgi:hypothetical protein
MDVVEVTSADIARLAGVRPTAVSNWRRRHPDFPEPVGGTEKSPRFSLDAVRDWLEAQGKSIRVGSRRELRQAVSAAAVTTPIAQTLQNAYFALLHHAGEEQVDAEHWRRRIAEDQVALAARYQGLEGPSELEEIDTAQAVMLNTAAQAAVGEDLPELAAELYNEVVSSRLGKGEIATSSGLAKLMVSLAAPSGGTLLDIACGAGTILLEAASQGRDRLLGMEPHPARARLAALRLAAAGLEQRIQADLQMGSALHTAPFLLGSAAAVVSHLPFNDRTWAESAPTDEAHWPYGIPPGRESELAWLQRALAHLRPDGIAVLVMPPAAADRLSGKRIRLRLLSSGALEAVIALPRGSLHGTSLAPHLWLLSSREKADPGRKVLMADFSALLDEERSPDWDRIGVEAQNAWDAYRTGEAPSSSRVSATPVMTLLQENVDLTPIRYLPLEFSGQDLTAARRDRERVSRSLRVLADRLDELPGEVTALPRPTRWESVEVLEANAELSFHRGLPPSREADGDARSVRVVRARPSRRATDAEEFVLVDEGHRLPEIREGDLLATVLDDRIHVRSTGTADIGAAPAWGTVLIRTDPRRVDPVFLASFLSSSLARQQLSRGSTSIGTNTVRELRRIRVGLPDIEEQQRQAEFFSQLAAIDAEADPLAAEAKRLAQTWRDHAWAVMARDEAPAEKDK